MHTVIALDFFFFWIFKKEFVISLNDNSFHLSLESTINRKDLKLIDLLYQIRYHHDLSDRNALPTNLKIKTRTMCILSAGVSLLSFESDEYEIIRITTTRRVKILPLID